MNFTIFHFFRKNEKTPETLDFTGFSGGVFGVPEVIRTPDLPLRSTFYTFFANAVWSLTTLQTRINTDFFSEHNVFSSLLFLLILRDDSNSN